MLRLGTSQLRVYGRAATFRLEVAWDVCRDAFANYFRNGALNQAAAIALYALLSIIPLFVLSVLAASRFLGAYQNIQDQIIGIVKSFHPYFDGDLLAQLGQVEGKSHVLGWIGIVSLIWFSSMIFGAVETALNISFRSEGHRNFLVSKLLAFAMIPLGWVTGLTSVLMTYVATLLSSQVFFMEGHFLNIHLLTRFILQYVVPFLVSILFATVLYVVIPSRRIRLRTAIAGSCLFTIMVELVKHVFTWYVANHTRYNAIFGSLETVVMLVIWVYYMALIFLFCAELMSSYERRDMLLIEHVLMDRRSRTGRQRLFRKFGRVFPEGTVICREGDLSQEMFFILSGKVRLEKRTGLTGKTLAELGPGAYFGEMAALTGMARTATAITATDCDVAVIDGQVFHRLLRESDDLSLHLLKEFSERIRRTNSALDDLSQSWFRSVVLVRLIGAWPWTPDRDILQEIAAATGKEPAEIQRILASLAQEGVLDCSEGHILAFHADAAWQSLQALSDTPGSLVAPLLKEPVNV
jgi:membrane protein